MALKIKRIYQTPSDEDGFRVLIDRLWPRGMSKEKAKIDWWFKEISPSSDLRKWYQHDLAKWDQFRTRYFNEIENNPDIEENLKELLKKIKEDTVTLIFSTRHLELNNAVALKEYLENRLQHS